MRFEREDIVSKFAAAGRAEKMSPKVYVRSEVIVNARELMQQ